MKRKYLFKKTGIVITSLTLALADTPMVYATDTDSTENTAESSTDDAASALTEAKEAAVQAESGLAAAQAAAEASGGGFI